MSDWDNGSWDDDSNPWEEEIFEDDKSSENWEESSTDKDKAIEVEYEYEEDVVYEDLDEQQNRNRTIAKRAVFFGIGMFLSGIGSAIFRDALNFFED